MFHPHPITQEFTKNTTAVGIDNDTIKKQQSCATNMKYFCIRDQKTFKKLPIA